MYFRRKISPSGLVLQLVQSYRNEQDSPRQRILASLGAAAIPETDWRLIARHVAAALKKSDQNELIPNKLSAEQTRQVDWVVAQIKRQGARAAAVVRTPQPAASKPTTPARSKTTPATDELQLDEFAPAAPSSPPAAAPALTPAVDPLDPLDPLEKIEHSHASSAGPELVGLHAWNALKLTQALKEKGLNDAQIRCAQVSVINRLVEPVSEHALGPWLENVSSLPDLLGEAFHGVHIEGRFLRVSDLLYKNTAFLEAHLRQQQEQHFGRRPAIFLYDLTNTYFEGQATGNPEAKHGHSKEKRDDCPLVSIALAYSEDGLPLGHKVFAGNQNDAASFPEVLALLKSEWKDLCSPDQKPLFVMDCGIATEANLLLLRQNGFDYLVSERRSKRSDFDEEFAQLEGFTEIPDKGVFVKLKTTTMPADAPLDPQAPSPNPAPAASVPPASAPSPPPGEPTTNPSMETDELKPFTPQPWTETRLFCKSEARGEKETAMLAKACTRLEADLQKLAERIKKGKINAPEKVAHSIGRLCERHSSVARYYEITPQLQNAGPATPPAPTPPTPPNTMAETSSPTTAATLAAPPVSSKKQRKLKPNKGKALTGVRALVWRRKPETDPEALCGAYCLRSTRSFTEAPLMWALYTGLTNAEDGFRCLKGDLGLRPVHHQIKERVHAHIFISVLALHLLAFIKKSLVDAGEAPRTWTTLKTILRNHAYVTLTASSNISTSHLRKIGAPNAAQKRIYDLLGIHLADCPVSRFSIPHTKN